MQIERRIEYLTSNCLTIELPTSFVNHKVEVLISIVDEAPTSKKRRSPPSFPGPVIEKGDVINTLSFNDWNLPK
jgi:hypothetical protein